MKTLFLAIPNHIFASDLLRTRYIEYLSARYNVVVLTPFIDTDMAKKDNYFQSSNVTYLKRPLENMRLWSFFKFLRISLVNEFDYLKSVLYFYRRPNYTASWKRRLLRAIGLPFSKILTADFFTKIEQKFLPKSKSFELLCAKYQPSLLLTATPGFDLWEAEVILLAKRAGISTAAMNFTWDNLTMNAKHIRKTDFLIAWNDIMKQEAIAIHHYSPDRVFVSGTPRFDPYFDKTAKDLGREEFLKSKGLNPKYKTIFHTTVTKAYPFQKKYIRDLINLRESGKIPYVNLFVRIHPLDLPENYKEFLGIPDFCLEKAGSEVAGKVEMNYGDLLNLKYSLQYSDLNVNYASTISVEACIFDKPIINIGYLDRFALAYQFNHYEPIYRSGAVKLVKDDADLPRSINMYLADPALDRENRQKIVETYVRFTDGLSYKRSVDFLEKCLL